jgi:hypothetical protein
MTDVKITMALYKGIEQYVAKDPAVALWHAMHSPEHVQEIAEKTNETAVSDETLTEN